MQLWLEEARRGLCCSSLPLGQLAPSSRLKDPEARTETGRGALAIFALLILIFAEVPVFFIFCHSNLSLAYSRLRRKE